MSVIFLRKRCKVNTIKDSTMHLLIIVGIYVGQRWKHYHVEDASHCIHLCVNEINDDSLAVGRGSTEKIVRVWGSNETRIYHDLLKKVDARTIENSPTIELKELLGKL